MLENNPDVHNSKTWKNQTTVNATAYMECFSAQSALGKNSDTILCFTANKHEHSLMQHILL